RQRLRSPRGKVLGAPPVILNYLSQRRCEGTPPYGAVAFIKRSGQIDAPPGILQKSVYSLKLPKRFDKRGQTRYNESV
ncbi:MAG: hypothetical protein Q4F17_12595, partial [Eubacteriales bacterium]|nr:hypothetical protein [Eubacteriales bacterium]